MSRFSYLQVKPRLKTSVKIGIGVMTVLIFLGVVVLALPLLQESPNTLDPKPTPTHTPAATITPAPTPTQSPTVTPTPVPTGLSETEQTEAYIFQFINKERADRDLPILGTDANLSVISKEWSEYLASINDLTHGDFASRMESIGYSSYSCGEIIAYTSGGTPSEVARKFVDMWLESPPHREIMLTSFNGYMGVGVSKSVSAFYGVVDFRFG